MSLYVEHIEYTLLGELEKAWEYEIARILWRHPSVESTGRSHDWYVRSKLARAEIYTDKSHWYPKAVPSRVPLEVDYRKLPPIEVSNFQSTLYRAVHRAVIYHARTERWIHGGSKEQALKTRTLCAWLTIRKALTLRTPGESPGILSFSARKYKESRSWPVMLDSILKMIYTRHCRLGGTRLAGA